MAIFSWAALSRCVSSRDGESLLLRKRFVASGKDAKDLIEKGRLENAADIFANSEEGEMASVGGDFLHRLDETRHAATIDALHFIEVDENGVVADAAGQFHSRLILDFHIERGISDDSLVGVDASISIKACAKSGALPIGRWLAPSPVDVRMRASALGWRRSQRKS
jgi:hypothetical protein